MKTVITLALFCLIWLNMVAQVPQSFHYQAVARDNSGNVLANQAASYVLKVGMCQAMQIGQLFLHTWEGKVWPEVK